MGHLEGAWSTEQVDSFGSISSIRDDPRTEAHIKLLLALGHEGLCPICARDVLADYRADRLSVDYAPGLPLAHVACLNQ